MSSNKLTPLSEMIAKWPAGLAETQLDLITVDYDVLMSTLEEGNVDPEMVQFVLNLRSHGAVIRNSATTEPALASPDAVLHLIGVTLRPPANRWITYALDATRHRISIPHKHSGSKYICMVTTKLPTPAELRESAPLPKGGAYLIVRADTLAVLEIEGVLGRIANLERQGYLADVVIYDVQPDQPAPTVYSLRAGVGARAGSTVPLTLSEDITKKVGALWHA
jgi:hypothetical protein